MLLKRIRYAQSARGTRDFFFEGGSLWLYDSRTVPARQENAWSCSGIEKGFVIHLLRVIRIAGRSRLVNCGFYVTTDYGDFESLIVQIHTLIREDEWYFARREYLRAFSLIRGKPFQSMYDIWSDDMRRAVLNLLEKEVERFAELCQNQGASSGASKMLKKMKRFIE